MHGTHQTACVRMRDYMHEWENTELREVPLLPSCRSRHATCKPECISAKVMFEPVLSLGIRNKGKVFIGSMPEERNRGPMSILQVMCVVFSLANRNLNKLICVHLKGRCVCCVLVGDKEHPRACAGVSWGWNLYICQIPLAVNHLLKDFHGKDMWQPLKIFQCRGPPTILQVIDCTLN